MLLHHLITLSAICLAHTAMAVDIRFFRRDRNWKCSLNFSGIRTCRGVTSPLVCCAPRVKHSYHKHLMWPGVSHSVSCTGLQANQVCLAMVAKNENALAADSDLLAFNSCYRVCGVRGGPCLRTPGYACFGCDNRQTFHGVHIGTYIPQTGQLPRGDNSGHDVRGGGAGDGGGGYGGGGYGGGGYGGGGYGGVGYGGGGYGAGGYGGGGHGAGGYGGGGHGAGGYGGGGHGAGGDHGYGGGNDVWGASVYNALTPKCNQTVEPDVFTIEGHHFAVGARYGTPPHITDQFWELDENDNLTYASLPAHLLAYENSRLMDP